MPLIDPSQTSVVGTPGNDAFEVTPGGAVFQLDALAGIDTVSFGLAQYNRFIILSPDSDGVVMIDSVARASWFYHIELKNVEVLTWDSGTVVIDLAKLFGPMYGTDGNDRMYAGLLYGGPKVDDVMFGLDGDDFMVGGVGNDTIDGGPGVDTSSYSGPYANYTVSSSTVMDKTGKDGTDTLVNVEIFQFSDLKVIFASADTLPARINGADIVHVAAGATLNATVSGAAWTTSAESGNAGIANISTYGVAVDLSAVTSGNGFNITNKDVGTTLRGSGLDDVITLVGGDGTWTTGYAAANEGSPGAAGTGQQILLDGKIRSANVLDGSNGSDTLQLTGGSDAFFLHDAYSLFNAAPTLVQDGRGMPSTARIANIEIIVAGAGDDLVDLTSANYRIGGVRIDGGSGNDVLWGNAGDDTLLGGSGNDALFGGAGHNVLNGGTGADIFQYVKNGGAHDVIQDFQPGEDTIRLFGAASVAEVTVTLNGGNVLLTWGDQTIQLTGLTTIDGAADWFRVN